jgi:hypothetical protein
MFIIFAVEDLSHAKVYMNVDPVLRHAVDQIPAGDWL